MVPCLYMSEMALPAVDVHGFKQWFAGRHAPDLYESGFLSCACYRGVLGDVTIYDLYQLPSWEVLNSAPYTDLVVDDGKKYYSGTNKWGAQVIYDQARIDEFQPEKCSFRTLSWITVIRYDGDLPAIEAALQQATPEYEKAGAVRARYARQGKLHPRATAKGRPDGICMIESGTELAAMRLNAALQAAMPGFAEEVSSFVGERVAPWPDEQIHGD